MPRSRAQYGNYIVLSGLAAKQAFEHDGSSPSPSVLTENPSMGKPGTMNNKFERETWPELAHLASDLPDAGIHFQRRNDINGLATTRV